MPHVRFVDNHHFIFTAGSRLAAQLGMPISTDGMLALVNNEEAERRKQLDSYHLLDSRDKLGEIHFPTWRYDMFIRDNCTQFKCLYAGMTHEKDNLMSSREKSGYATREHCI